MIIIGIDPGVQRAGFAVLEKRGTQLAVLELGTWDLLKYPKGARPVGSDERRPLGDRLEQLHASVAELFGRYNPRIIGLEKAITFKNVASALKLSEARAVVRLAAHQRLESAHERLFELSPTQVKRHAAASGGATKEQVLRVLSLRFTGLAEIAAAGDFTHDAFDALAIAWTAWAESQRARTIAAATV